MSKDDALFVFDNVADSMLEERLPVLMRAWAFAQRAVALADEMLVGATGKCAAVGNELELVHRELKRRYDEAAQASGTLSGETVLSLEELA